MMNKKKHSILDSFYQDLDDPQPSCQQQVSTPANSDKDNFNNDILNQMKSQLFEVEQKNNLLIQKVNRMKSSILILSTKAIELCKSKLYQSEKNVVSEILEDTESRAVDNNTKKLIGKIQKYKEKASKLNKQIQFEKESNKKKLEILESKIQKKQLDQENLHAEIEEKLQNLLSMVEDDESKQKKIEEIKSILKLIQK